MITPSQLRAAIEAAGITQERAAQLMHISRSSLVKQLAGTHQVNMAGYELLVIKTGQSVKCHICGDIFTLPDDVEFIGWHGRCSGCELQSAESDNNMGGTS